MDSSSDEDSSSLDEPCSSRADLVLNVEIRKDAFVTEESLSRSIHNFLGKAISGINGQPVTQKQEMTAVIGVQDSGIYSMISCNVYPFFCIVLVCDN